MNYRHAYHAGNFADVLKHTILARCIEHLKAKPAPFRVIDTHAGIGIYDLSSEAAQKTGEWKDGIGRVLSAHIPTEVKALLLPYLSTIEALKVFKGRHVYPGSPEIARHLTRGEDRMIFVERHPQDAKKLADVFSFDGRAKILELDGYVATKAYVPPKERRGLVIIDPPYEERDEFATMFAAFVEAYRKWPTGMYLLWYPVKNFDETKRFMVGLAEAGIPKILRAELRVKRLTEQGGLAGSGVIIVNPPWKLADELRVLLPWLDGLLKQDEGHGWNVDWLAGEVVAPLP
jgi:23S rRNA (adenine2030-N6)-methyltransferase